MLRQYKVAGHIFAISLPDDSPIWDLTGQYEPFGIRSGTVPGQNPLFTLTLTDEIPKDEWKVVLDQPSEDGEPVVKVLRSSAAWLLEVSPDHRVPTCSRIWISEDFSDVRVKLECKGRGRTLFALNNALMLSYAFSTAGYGTLEIHASMVGNGGKAYLFIAPSGTGKSTHSTLWLENIPGSELMNDDNPIIRAYPDGRIVAYGSPWSGKTPCYRNVQAEIGAIVKIRRCKDNAITKLSLPEAFAELYSSCSGLKTDELMSDRLCDSITAVVSSISCYVLDCRPDRDAALVCSREVLDR